jgi:ankyrin repeat protein
LKYGDPHPYCSDNQGKNAIHIAAAKQDFDTFEKLIEYGFDPMMPDSDGNTFLHLVVEGQIKEK